MLFTYILVFLFFIILTIIILYFLSIYVFPRKIEEIQKMIEAGQVKLAIKKLNEILEKDDRNPYAHFLLAEAYAADGNSQYAVVEYRQVLKMGRFDDKIKEVHVRTVLAKLFKDKKAFEDARKEYLILTKLDPSNFENFYELGVMSYNLGQLDKALNYFRKSASLNSKHDQSYFYLGQIYYKNGVHVDAKQCFLNTIKIDPSNYQAHYYLGLVLRQQGDYEWALKEFEVSMKSDELKVKSLLARGTCFMEKSQYPKAIMEFERGVKFAKKGSDMELNLRYFLGECQEKVRDVHSAIVNWEKIAEINPKFRDIQQKLAAYAEFRQDDRIKDFMIAGLAQFEHMTRKIVASMNYNITDIEIISDTEIEIIATENEGKWRNTRQSNRIIRVIRTTESLPDSYFRKIHESMKPRNATRILVITTGEISPKALEFANTRPIEIKGKTELVELLKKI
ncbi:MAG TPA: tetratricopeptide repeat protein [Spirochaetota bacterium]|nr:tetratricopeptide repeat protein [Spirochaetota bacterium]HPF05613.1 tetratricopeptide repeat protein [Spirochaetota bacterium]HPJ42774.1 tetratricopeptide repeat protein [Spirochaetota bacterium]HPR36515.1 tetratricopeptide repeat protein [Spirochaetota bacterium]HRX47014.1 tetratricopeptide repeat protein [Spirochaetota bacterium]